MLPVSVTGSPPVISHLLEDTSSSSLLQPQDEPPKRQQTGGYTTQQIQKKIQCGVYHVVLKRTSDEKRKSVIWETFGEILDQDNSRIAEHVACSKCHKVYRFLPHKTGTSNILKHRCQSLLHLMPSVPPVGSSESLRAVKLRRKKDPPSSRKDRDRSSLSEAAAPSARPGTPSSIVSPCISDANQRQLRCIKETLTKETVCFVCSDLLPLDVVFRPGLSGLLQACVDLGVKYGQFEVAHTMPSPVVLRQRLRILASECRRKLSAELKGLLNTIGGSLSLQTWKDPETKAEHFIVTLHSMQNFSKVTRCLRMAEWDAEYRLTCDNMVGVLYQTLKDYDLHDFFHRLVYVTDQDSELVTALGTATRLSCVTSAINAVLEFTLQVDNADVASDVYCLWNYCVILVSHLQRTNLHDLLDNPIYRPKDTSCWVNRLEFLQSILSQWGQITKALGTTDEEAQYTSPINISLLEEIVKFITPFRQAIRDLSESRKPTLHLVVVWYTRLVKEMQPENTDSILINTLKTHARMYLMQMEVHQLHRIALFLHPKLKSLKLLQDDGLKLSVQAEVRSMLSAQVINCYMEANTTSNQVTLQKSSTAGVPTVNGVGARRSTGGLLTLSDLEDTSDDDGSQFDSDEVNKYLLLRVPKTPAGTEFDLLKWWAAHELELPRLSRVAQFVHSIPASHRSRASLCPATVDYPELADDMILLNTCMV
ncbi:zinc finger protein 618-like isoform X2 [Varroa destructor]|uniref:BED-type domain-containing protein n=1 Tax=Varroa destructor TaxID=109461 RepID=A0A7M7M5Y5_VARDE|nr:zinc finger protein 618-like isoform X2 [Varroa destructor]